MSIVQEIFTLETENMLEAEAAVDISMEIERNPEVENKELPNGEVSDLQNNTAFNLGSSKKIKKPMSAWILFSTKYREIIHKEQPNMSFKEIAQALSERYKLITSEEKLFFEDLASKDKLRYQEEMHSQSLQESYNSLLETTSSSNPYDLILPLARVKKTMKLDPEVKNIQKEALLVVAKVTELFLQYMGVRAYNLTSQRRAKSIKTDDVIQSIHSIDTLKFLRVDFPKTMAPNLLQNGKKKQSNISNNGNKSTREQPDTASSSILSFFSSKRKASYELEASMAVDGGSNGQDDEENDDLADNIPSIISDDGIEENADPELEETEEGGEEEE